MNHEDDPADFHRGLRTVQGFLKKEKSDDTVKLLFDYADNLLIFYFTSKSMYYRVLIHR